MNIIVTGGAGFIGISLVSYLLKNTEHNVINIDKLTYASDYESIAEYDTYERYYFEQIDICDPKEITKIIHCYNPDAIIHLAAETHVDRSIDNPANFVQTNIIGTYNLLESTRTYWGDLQSEKKASFRFHHVSTDEVYGELGMNEASFTEDAPYSPRSPYSATKASSDHLVRAWFHTFGLPVLITNCSNNYGPYQFPEKLIPLITLNAIEGKQLPVYGKGNQIRDWLYVEDHVRAIIRVLEKGQVGHTYNIGGHNEMTNLDVVKSICIILNEIYPIQIEGLADYAQLIVHVEDRPGHDQRYSVNTKKIEHELGWQPEETFTSGLRKTVKWYLKNKEWCDRILDGNYNRERLGLIGNEKD